MKKKNLLIFFSLILNVYSYGQYYVDVHYSKLDSLVMNFINELQQNNIDTVCVYRDYYNGTLSKEEDSNRCGYLSLFIPTYILWISNGKTFLHKKDNCYNYNAIEVDAKSVWDVLFKYQHQMEKEKVKMFEYKAKGEVYINLVIHSSIREFSTFIKGNEIIRMRFYEMDMKEEDGEMKNINYLHNKNLKGKILVDELQELIRGIEKEGLLIRDGLVR